jgi:hypothetical protein
MLLIAASLLVAATSASIDDRINSEVDRLDALLKSKEAGAPQQLAELPKLYHEMLDKVRAAKTPQTRLYRLRPPFGGIEAIAFNIDHMNAAKDDASLEKLWNAMKPKFQNAAAARGTFLERAVQQAAMNRAEKLFAASIAYSKVDDPGSRLQSGLYYISEAEGSRRYAEFVRKIASADDHTTVPSEKSLRSAVDEVQNEAIKSFEKDAASRSMIQTNAKLKETRELLDGKRLEAATIALLEARYELSKRDPHAASTPVALKNNDAVTALWSEIASLETADNARAIREDVLPLYASLPTRKVAAKTAAGKPVTVTLIRWPYT